MYRPIHYDRPVSDDEVVPLAGLRPPALAPALLPESATFWYFRRTRV